MFQLSEEQQQRVEVWLKELHPQGVPYGGAIGGSLTYSFTPTGLGVITVVTCNHTHKELDITNYDNW